MQDEMLKIISRIDHLIRIKGTGRPKDLADRLGVSRRSVFFYLNFMKERGAPIKYCFDRKSYYYDEEGSFIVTIAFLKKEEVTQKNIA